MFSKKIFWTILLLTFLLFILSGTVFLNLAKNHAQSRIMDWLNGKFSDTITYRGIIVSPFGNIHIRDLRSTDEPLHISSLKINVKPFSLIKNHIEFSDIRIEGMNAKISRNQDNQWNVELFKNFFQSLTDSSLKPLKIKRFSIINSNVLLGDAKLDLSVDCENLNFHLRNDVAKQKISGRCGIRSAEILIGDKIHIINKVRNTFTIQNKIVKISSRGTYFERSPIQLKVQLNASKNFDLTGEIQAKPDLFEISKISGMPDSIMQGLPAVNCKFNGQLKDFTLKAELNVNRMRAYKTLIQNFHATLIFDDRKCQFSDIKVQLLDGTLYSDGVVHYSDTTKEARFKFTVKDVALNPLLQLVQSKTHNLNGQFNGKGNFSFQWSAFKFSSLKSNLILSKTTYKKMLIPDSQFDLLFKNNQLQAALSIQSATARFKGTLIDRSWQNAKLSCDIPDVDIFRTEAGESDLSGKFKMQALVKGGFTNPDIDGAFNITNFTSRGAVVDSMSGIFHGDKHHLTIDESHFAGKIINLSKFASYNQLPKLQGTGNYEGTLTGDVKNPQLFVTALWDSCGLSKYRVDHCSSTILYRNRAISRISATAINNNSPLYIEFQTASGNPHHVNCVISPYSLNLNPDKNSDNYILISGNYMSSKSGALNAVINKLQLNKISKFFLGDDKIAGVLNGEGKIQQPLQKPNISLKMHVDDFHTPDLQFQEIESSFSYYNDNFEIESLSLIHDNQTMLISGTIPIEPNEAHPFKQLDLSITAAHFPLSCLSKYDQFYTAERADANINFQISGNLTHPQINGDMHFFLKKLQNKFSKRKLQSAIINLQVDGKLNQPDFSVDWQSTNLNWENFYASSFHGDLAYSDSLIQLKNVTLDLFQNKSQITGTIPASISLDPPRIKSVKKPVNLKSKADKLNLAFFNPFFPVIEHLTGNLNYDFEISGTFKEPIVFGRVDIDNTEIKLKNITPPITKLNAAIRFTGLQTTIDTCHARIGDGYLTIHNGSAIRYPDNIRTWNCAAHFINIPLTYENVFEARIDTGKLYCNAICSELKIDGIIDIKNCKIIKEITPRELDRLDMNLNLCKISETAFFNSVNTEIDLNFKDFLQWDNRHLNIRMEPQLKIIGNLCQPMLKGSIQIVEGNFRYLNRRFLVSRGVLKFSEKHENSPEFDIHSHTLVRSYENINQKNYLITLSLAGYIEKYEYGLTSSPVLSQPDMIAMLTKGKIRKPMKKEAITGELSYSDILVERARNLTSQSVESIAEKQVGTLLNLDKVDVKWNYSDKNDRDRKGTRIVAQKKLTSELDITYTSVVGYSNDQAIKLEYKISDTISLEGESDQKGRTGIDVKFKYNFK